MDVTEYTEEPLHRHAKSQQMPEPPPMPAASLLVVHAGHAGKIVTRGRYITIYTIAGKLGNRVSSCLPAAHPLKGVIPPARSPRLASVQPSQSW